MFVQSLQEPKLECGIRPSSEISEFQIFFDNDNKDHYIPGESVSGSVRLILNNSLKAYGVKFNILGKAEANVHLNDNNYFSTENI